MSVDRGMDSPSVRVATVYWYQTELGKKVELIEANVRGDKFIVPDGVNLGDR